MSFPVKFNSAAGICAIASISDDELRKRIDWQEKTMETFPLCHFHRAEEINCHRRRLAKTFDKFRFSSGRKQFCHENPIFNFDFYFLVAYRMRKLDRKFSNVFLKRNYLIFRRIIFLNMFFNFQKFRKNVKYYQNIKFNFWTFF